MALYHALVLVLAFCLLIYLGQITEKNPNHIVHPYVQFSHLASVGALFGVTLWVTFFAGVLLFKYLPRHTFGEVQSHIFPWYFAITFVLASIGLASYLYLENITSAQDVLHDKPALSLVISITLTVIQLLILGPLVTEAMRARHKQEKEEGWTQEKIPANAKKSPALVQISKKFALLHGLSSSANLVVILAAIYHLWTTSNNVEWNSPRAAAAAKASFWSW